LIRSFSGALLLALVTFPAATTSAQPTVPDPVPAPKPATLDAGSLISLGATEWMATVGNGWSSVMFHSASGHKYVMQTLSWGRVLTAPHFPGALRGRFEWAFEAIPVYAQYTPDTTYGFGLTPVVWRWNFEPRGRYAPFAQLAGGALWTTSPVPQNTSTANFTANVGAGVRIVLKSHEALVLMYRFDHISNGNRLEANPGVNAHALHFGLSVMRPRSP
jgi:lipid A 3-O-deacylase PagL